MPQQLASCGDGVRDLPANNPHEIGDGNLEIGDGCNGVSPRELWEQPSRRGRVCDGNAIEGDDCDARCERVVATVKWTRAP